MKKIALLALLFAACNNDKANTDPDDLTKEDQNRPTDTRTVNPMDTSSHIDTGSYHKLSDSIRKH